jgi:hypothetical protein
MLYVNPLEVASHPRSVTGQYLAKNHLNARARAQLAADILGGRAEVADLTVAQITRLCRSNRIYVAEARDPGRAYRRRQQRLARVFNSIEPDARAELCRTIGVERVWTALAQAIG